MDLLPLIVSVLQLMMFLQGIPDLDEFDADARRELLEFHVVSFSYNIIIGPQPFQSIMICHD